MSSPAVPAIPTARALSRVLAPLAERAFFDTHWERGPVHVGRDDPDHFGDLLTLADIERVLSSRELRFPDVQLTRSGTPVPVEDYADAASRILPRRLIARHRDGATVVLSRAHDLFPPLNDLVRELEGALGWRCQTNVYLSPPGNRGFGSHYDSHDVFILQVGGKKTFRFYSGGPELPFTDERYDPDATGERVPGEVIELAAGDTLYIPRGVLHDAVAYAGAPSLHVTLGVFPVVLRDVLRELVQVAAEREPALRRSVPRGPWAGSEHDVGALVTRLRDALSGALGDMTHDGACGEALTRLRDEVALDGAPDCAGSLSVTVDPAPDSRLVVRSGVRAAFERRGSAVRLRLPGEVIELDEPLATAVERLVHDGHGRVDALAGLDDDGRLALARRLIEHGIVDVTDR